VLGAATLAVALNAERVRRADVLWPTASTMASSAANTAAMDVDDAGTPSSASATTAAAYNAINAALAADGTSASGAALKAAAAAAAAAYFEGADASGSQPGDIPGAATGGRGALAEQLVHTDFFNGTRPTVRTRPTRAVELTTGGVSLAYSTLCVVAAFPDDNDDRDV